MFMQIKLMCILLFVLCAMASLTNPIPDVRAETVQDKCGPEEGFVQIGIAGSGKSWFYEWSSSGLKLTEKRNDESFAEVSAPEESVYAGEWYEKVAGLPQDFLSTGERLDTPFAVSPDGQWLISAVYPGSGSVMLSPSRTLALIDRKSKRLVCNFQAQYKVKSLAWAPSGKHFAVLLSHDVTKEVWKGPLDWFASLVGHPISHHTLYAAIYDLQGKLLCEKRIIEKLSIGRGYLVWEAAKKSKGVNVEGKINRKR
jgi:hypothetical protein